MVATADLKVEPIEANFSLKDRIYTTLRKAITSMNIYAENAELRLDERELSEKLAISRTPIREALARLEQEGLVRIVPRKGVFIVRKTKAEILEMITVWAALESMAARLVTERASDQEIASLRRLFTTFEGEEVGAHIDEYSERNIDFHSRLLQLSKCELLNEMARNLFIHIHIIEALEARDTDLAERLVREHTLNLAAHVAANVDYLD